MEAIYQEVIGVSSVVSGYSGGTVESPTDKRVYEGDTGHAEVVQITFDKDVITYKEILEIFFTLHDPTTLNRQGNDVGDEYRSVIFYHDETQKRIAEEMTRIFATQLWDDPVVTQIEALEKFWPAPDHHQNFYRDNQQVGYCQIIINPKLQKFREKFKAKLRQA